MAAWCEGPQPGWGWRLPSPTVEDTDIWSVGGISVITGAIAAAIAIVAGVGSWLRWLRARRQRRHVLRDLLDEVEEQNTRLRNTAVEVSRVMIESGITWTGWRIPPPELTPHLMSLAEIDRALESLHARVRGVRAEPAVERLRADIELAVTTLRRGVDLHTEGSWATYREAFHDDYPDHDDRPRTFTKPDPTTSKRRYFGGASGQDPVPALHDEKAVDEVHRLSRDLDLAVRSAWHQMGDDERAAAFSAGWPRRSYEIVVDSAA
jgi:hypothetical protein